MCQLFAVGVGFGSVLLFVTAEEFLSCTLFIGKDKAHLGSNVRKNKLVQNLDLNIVACTSSLPEFGIRSAGPKKSKNIAKKKFLLQDEGFF